MNMFGNYTSADALVSDLKALQNNKRLLLTIIYSFFLIFSDNSSTNVLVSILKMLQKSKSLKDFLKN